MTDRITIKRFQGIAPRFDPHLKPGFARTAQNCDLSDGKIQALKQSSLQEADTNKYNSLFYFNSAWEKGNDKYFLEWKIGDYDLLIYLTNGVPKKKIGTSEANLGQTRLGAPTVATNGAGNVNDTVRYMITTTRSVGGHEDESGPSTQSDDIVASNKKVTVTRPDISDTDVTYWNIYRNGDKTGVYQLVAQVAAATAAYDDNVDEDDLGASPTTWYTSDQGNSIIFDTPQVTFDGLITEPFTGMLFAWKGPTLYWPEPGYPDAWPDFYNMNFPSDIKRVIPFAGTLAVLTEKGPHRVDGTHPELLQPSKVLGEEPCTGLAACPTPRGVAYLSDSGVVLFNLIDTSVLSDSNFTEEWFNNNVSATGAHLAENDNKLFLFHSGGVLVLDARVKPWIWHTLNIIAYASFKNKSDGYVYYMDDSGIQKLHGADSPLTWTWMSGDIIGKHAHDKPFNEVEVMGSGAVTLSLIVDDQSKASKTLGFDMYRNRVLKLPEHTLGRALQFELSGTGTITEVEVRYSS